MKKVLLAFFLGVSLVAAAADKKLVNLGAGGLALEGYDPVAFFTVKQPVKGSPAFQSTYHGARYWFASAENKKTFEQDPAKYEPQFGGYCAYGVSRGKAKPVKIEAFQIVDGRLLMQYDIPTRDAFAKDPQGNLKLADQMWLSVVEKYGN